MTRDEAKQVLPLISAYADGKTIQYRMDDGTWLDAPHPAFWPYTECYRVKPEPVECWAVVDCDGDVIVSYKRRENAERHNDGLGFRVARMVEAQ